MSFIIGNKCVDCLDTSCVKVCPVDCINGPFVIDGRASEVGDLSEEQRKGLQLFIDPEQCILCGACIPECPVDAIFESEKEALFFEKTEDSNIDARKFADWAILQHDSNHDI